jgi:predicted DNA binding CopG/RHH family protein
MSTTMKWRLGMAKNPLRTLSARVPSDTAWAVKEVASALRISVQEFVNQAVEDKLARHPRRICKADHESVG